MGAYVFIIFAGVAAFVTVFLIKFAPETKGKSFEEIEAELNDPNKKLNKKEIAKLEKRQQREMEKE